MAKTYEELMAERQGKAAAPSAETLELKKAGLSDYDILMYERGALSAEEINSRLNNERSKQIYQARQAVLPAAQKQAYQNWQSNQQTQKQAALNLGAFRAAADLGIRTGETNVYTTLSPAVEHMYSSGPYQGAPIRTTAPPALSAHEEVLRQSVADRVTAPMKEAQREREQAEATAKISRIEAWKKERPGNSELNMPEDYRSPAERTLDEHEGRTKSDYERIAALGLDELLGEYATTKAADKKAGLASAKLSFITGQIPRAAKEKYAQIKATDPDAENKVRGSEASRAAAYRNVNDPNSVVWLLGEYGTDEEKFVHSYIFATQGRKAADAYLLAMSAAVAARKTQEIYEKARATVEDVQGADGALLRGAKQASLAVGAGFEQWIHGFSNFAGLMEGRDYYIPSHLQTASGAVLEELGGTWGSAGGVALTGLQTISSMIPSILIGKGVGALAGAAGAMAGGIQAATTAGTGAAIFLTASGNGYANGIAQGLSPTEAAGYGLLTGASEAVLQVMIGGIVEAGGGLASKTLSTAKGQSFLNAIDGALKSVVTSEKARFLLRVGISMAGDSASEFFEESLQSILEPLFLNLVTGEDIAEINLKEAIRDGLMGAIVALSMNSIPAVRQSLAGFGTIDHIQALNEVRAPLGLADVTVESDIAAAVRETDAALASLQSEIEAAAEAVAQAEKEAAANVNPVEAAIDNLLATGEISSKQMEAILKTDGGREAFTERTGVELPRHLGDARRAIRSYQATVTPQTVTQTQGTTAAQTNDSAGDIGTASVTQAGVSSAVESDTFGRSVGAAMPNPRQTNAQLVERYGAFEQGEAPRARDIEIARRTNAGYVSRFARTAAEATATDATMAEQITRDVAGDTFTYVATTNKAEQQKAVESLAENGYEKTIAYVDTLFKSDKRIKVDDIALAEAAYAEAVKRKDYTTARELVADLAVVGTEMGQSISALRILKQFGAEGRLLAVQKALDRLNAQYQGRKGFEKIKLSDATIENILSQTTEKGLKEAVEAAYPEVAAQIPASWAEKINAWRYFAMLANPWTHVRNILGNTVMLGMRAAKNTISTFGQQFIPKDQRTAAILNRFNAQDAELLTFAKSDFAEMQDIISSGGKYNPTDAIREQRKIFSGPRWAEFAREKSMWLLEAEDIFFLRHSYTRALAGILKARGLNPDTATAAQLDTARMHAMLEAQRATFRDTSKLANALTKLGQSGPFANLVVEGAVPFKKTPTNIIKRGVEYSPAGFLKAIKQGVQKESAATVIDSLSAGLTGTGVLALGMWLAAMGILRGIGDDEKKKRAFDALTGHQNYALQIGDWSLTLDWAAPAAMPLFVGVELYNRLFGEDAEEYTTFTGVLGALFESFVKITEPVFNMSMLSGLSSAIETAAYGSGTPIMDFAVGTLSSYGRQFIPSVFGAAARIIDDTRRSTQPPASAESSGITRFVKQQLAKMPGLSTTLEPFVDQWGREENTGNLAERLLQNLVLPGFVEKKNITSVDEELYDLYDNTGDSSILPGWAQKSFKVDGKEYRLTDEQYTKFSKTRGQTAHSTLDRLFKTSAYKALTDAEKISAISQAYSYATNAAKAEVARFDRPKWEEKAISGTLGYSVAEVIAYRALLSNITGEKDARGETISGSVKRNKIARLIEAGMPRSKVVTFVEEYP